MFQLFGRTVPSILGGRQFNESGLQDSIATAKELADELEMKPEETTFPRKADVRRRRKKTQFNFSNVLMDKAIMSFEERFSQLKKLQDIFGILFNIQTYNDIHSDYSRSAELLKLCRSLQQALSQKGDGTVDNESDIDGQSLYDELKTLASILPQNTVSPLEVLRYVVSNGLQLGVAAESCSSFAHLTNSSHYCSGRRTRFLG